MIRFRAIAAFLFGAFFTVASAQASVISTDNYLGTVSVGTTNAVAQTLKLGNSGSIGTGTITGYLPANSKITFTYTYTPTGKHSNTLLDSATLYSGAAYDYQKGSKIYYGEATANSTGDSKAWGVTYGSKSWAFSAPLVAATANIGSATLGTTTITNTSSCAAYFASVIDIVKKLYGKVVVTYTVSAVPLPAAFPLFGAALAGMAAFGRRRKAAQERVAG